MNIITKDWLKKNGACVNGADWFEAQKETDVINVAKKLINEGQPNWCNWLVSRWLPKIDKVRYAVFAAEQVISVFEKKYPDDNRPRKAIEAAIAWINDPSEENRKAASYAAADASYAAADAAYAAYAAYAAADAADAAAAAAYAAADAADAAADASYAAADASYAAADASYAAADAKKGMKTKILNYGISLIKEEK